MTLRYHHLMDFVRRTLAWTAVVVVCVLALADGSGAAVPLTSSAPGRLHSDQRPRAIAAPILPAGVTSIALSSPVAGAEYIAPADIPISVDLNEPDLIEVEFYANAELIGSATAEPYSIVWTAAVPATYDITAIGRDIRGTSLYAPPVQVAVRGRAADPLVQKANLQYVGAFRLPAADVGGSNFGYSGTALTYNPARDSLFVVGHDWHQKVAEISIPEVRQSAGVGGLATAAFLQPFGDPIDGKSRQVNPGDPNAIKVGGLFTYGDRLITSMYAYYDGAATQVLSHFISAQNLAVTTDALGPFRIGSLKAGYVSGYMATIPKAWQGALGGPALTGNCCINIISRSSFGPAVSSFDPADVGRGPVQATPLLYYPSDHPLANYDATSDAFNGTTAIHGVVFPEQTRSVLFFGRHGVGRWCYGTGTRNQAQHGTAVGDGSTYCYDPTSADKGTHAYPYVYKVWAYDAADLAAVKSGSREPWEIKPYAMWELQLPWDNASRLLGGVAYDPATNRIFVVQSFADSDRPVIQVFTLQFP